MRLVNASSTMTAKIDCGHKVFTVTFLQDGDHILTGGEDGAVLRWQRSDHRQVGSYINDGGDVQCLAASNDGRWIVVGTKGGVVTVWGTEQDTKVVETRHSGSILAVDISLDSQRVVSGSSDETASVWDIQNGGRQVILDQADHPLTLRFSPDGSRIATAQYGHRIRIFDSINGKELVQIRVYSPPTGIEWTSNGQRLLAANHGKITCFDAVTGSLLSEQRLGGYDVDSSMQMALARNQKFIVSTAEHAVSFWDSSTFNRIGSAIEHEEPVVSISLTPDGLYLVASGQDNRITIRSLQGVLPQRYLGKPAPQLPLLQVSHAAFMPWRQNHLEVAEAILTEEIGHSFEKDGHHGFANRSLLRARQGKWERAKSDAEESVNHQLSISGLIAKGWVLINLKKDKEAFETFELASMLCDVNESKLVLLVKYIMLCVTGACTDVTAHLTALSALVDNKSIYLLIQAQMYLHLGDQYFRQANYGMAMQSFERACVPASFKECPELQVISLVQAFIECHMGDTDLLKKIFGWRFENLRSVVNERIRRVLTSVPRTEDAIGSLLRLHGTFPDDLIMSSSKWINAGFMKRYIAVLEHMGDKAFSSNQRQEASLYYTATLFFSSSIDDTKLLPNWVNVQLDNTPWKDIWSTAAQLGVHETLIHRAVCENLETAGRLIEATECFNRMENGPTVGAWSHEFKKRLSEKLAQRVHTIAHTSQTHHEALELYSAALSFDRTSLDLLVRRSKAWSSVGKWDEAIRDADEAIKSEPSSPCGYEAKHAALLGAGRYDDAFEAYKTMFSKLPQSADHEIPQNHKAYIRPSEIEAAIREAVERTIRNSPRVLINTSTGRLQNKSQQASAFAATTDFKALCASMTSHIDVKQIKEVVDKYYRYVMLSHTWESDEPLFQLVEKIPVYELQKTRENDKLREFCSLVRDAGYHWAWSDTCCIDKQDQVVLQESLVSMFRWYHKSALTIVFLRDAALGLENCRWISRGWTYQEYVAGKVIRFYTENWKPYMGLTRWNHKEAPEIRSAMESKVKRDAELVHFVHELQPGQGDIRKKLSLASTRETTVVEDAAYSLLGIFSISIPVIYGEGESAALGRLLGHLLTATGDASILAWRGKSGSFNSCLPAHISVFQDLATSHLPQPLSDTDLNAQVGKFKRKTHDYHKGVTELYDRLNDLHAPSFAANRMKLACIMFQVESLSLLQTTHSGHHYRVYNDILGDVDIRTEHKLPPKDTLYLVHPWLDGVLLDRGFSLDKLTRAMRLFARLRQRFGALLLTLTGRGYQRVAGDAVIEVEVKEDTLKDVEYLRDNARTIDVS